MGRVRAEPRGFSSISVASLPPARVTGSYLQQGLVGGARGGTEDKEAGLISYNKRKCSIKRNPFKITEVLSQCTVKRL